MTYRNDRLLRLARLCPRCMGCGAPNQGNIVAAHSNEGKGMGMKNPDHQVAYLCALPCHYELDQGSNWTRDERRDFWDRAFKKTIGWLFESGHLIVIEEGHPLWQSPSNNPPPPPKPKRPIAKRKEPWSSRKMEGSSKMQSRPFPKSK